MKMVIYVLFSLCMISGCSMHASKGLALNDYKRSLVSGDSTFINNYDRVRFKIENYPDSELLESYICKHFNSSMKTQPTPIGGIIKVHMYCDQESKGSKTLVSTIKRPSECFFRECLMTTVTLTNELGKEFSLISIETTTPMQMSDLAIGQVLNSIVYSHYQLNNQESDFVAATF